jgi:hypothetical protein
MVLNTVAIVTGMLSALTSALLYKEGN